MEIKNQIITSNRDQALKWWKTIENKEIVAFCFLKHPLNIIPSHLLPANDIEKIYNAVQFDLKKQADPKVKGLSNFKIPNIVVRFKSNRIFSDPQNLIIQLPFDLVFRSHDTLIDFCHDHISDFLGKDPKWIRIIGISEIHSIKPKK